MGRWNVEWDGRTCEWYSGAVGRIVGQGGRKVGRQAVGQWDVVTVGEMSGTLGQWDSRAVVKEGGLTISGTVDGGIVGR